MSRQQHDADTQSRNRPRANTTSFPAFAWRRARTEQPLVPPVPAPPLSQQPLSMDGLIAALTPPAVPSLVYARALATVLPTQSPLPRQVVLNPVLASLCNADSPVAVQVAGYDIISAYWENTEAALLSTADRLSYISLFLASHIPWGMELWESRFKALKALTRYGVDIMGIETAFFEILKSWLGGGFDGLLSNDSYVVLDHAERAERERSIDIMAKFMSRVLENAETVARVSDEDLASVLHFYAGLVDRSILLHLKPPPHGQAIPPSIDLTSSNSTPSKSPSHRHRRNPSSVSINSIPSPTTVSPPAPKNSTKHPADIAITMYLNHLSSQLKTLSSAFLSTILPLLFRALAFCASPLPRLTVVPHPTKITSSEERITEMLNSLFAGPYSTACMLILKTYLFPPIAASGNQTTTHQDSPSQEIDIEVSNVAIQTSLGAHRTFRNYVRRALSTRLARAYISRETSLGYSHSGAPGHMDVEKDLMERAWPKEDYTSSVVGFGGNGWDAGRLGKILTQSVRAWVAWHLVVDGEREKGGAGKGDILEEAAGVLKDIFQELDAREGESGRLDEEEAIVVGETLYELVGYLHLLKNHDGTPYILPVSRPAEAPTPFLRSLSSLLSRDHATAINPLLSTTLIHIANNLTDVDTSSLPHIMTDQHELSPTSPDWLNNWGSLLGNRTLVGTKRPLTRRAIMGALGVVFEGVRDMKYYRRPLADMVWELCKRCVEEGEDSGDDDDATWRMLADEVVLRTTECAISGKEGEHDMVSRYIELLVAVATETEDEESEYNADTASVAAADTHSSSPFAPSTIISPILSRTQSEHQGQGKEKDKELGLPSVMSILSSLATGNSSRSQSIQPQVLDEILDDPMSPLQPLLTTSVSRVIGAVSALIAIFSQLTFTPFALEPKNIRLAVYIYNILLNVVTEARSTRARLTALQFLLHLRADRDHRLYFSSDAVGHVTMLSSLINRVWNFSASPATERRASEPSRDPTPVLRKTPAFKPQERDGRQLSRGHGAAGPSGSTASRSRSRAANVIPSTPASIPQTPLWHVPETFPFSVAEADPSEGLISYDPDGPARRIVLPVSSYLTAIVGVLDKERNWEILSYVLCHLPNQLANKHLFCGPKSRGVICKMLSVICAGILHGDLGSRIDRWPTGFKASDAQGLAHHTLTVLISYRRCFDLQQCHLLVEVLQTGLNGQLSTIKCCLHALSLSAFELRASMTKCLPRILEKLSQIMSNPNMAVHILAFLSIIGSIPDLYANFTESDYKMVFGVALQYLQHYNRLGASPTTSWALSQHVRILSYAILYTWFLAVKLRDRPRHIPFITRQLLLANEDNAEVDDPTEVAFDWLSRYTYASADPRPAKSVLGDIVMNPPVMNSPSLAISEKTWMMGHTVVTYRTLARRGWIEILCRRSSGFSKFLCRVENAPMVGPGDVDPDVFSLPAGLMMERDSPKVQRIESDMQPEDVLETQISGSVGSTTALGSTTASGGGQQNDVRRALMTSDEGGGAPRPDPVTGYVWSGSAPSQRRKNVEIDASYFSLQLSAYPNGMSSHDTRTVVDPTALSKFVSTLDRIPVIDTHKVGIMYVAPGQIEEGDILRNTHGSPAYTRFLEGLGRLINLRGQLDVYAGGLDPNEDGEYAYAWWDDIGQILYHTATMMPSTADDPQCNNKKRHIGNDYVRIIWNDSGKAYRFDTLATQFQFVNIVIEPHSLGAIAAFSNNIHEIEYFKVTVQRAPGMTEFSPIGHFKLISAENLPLLVRQLSLLADWFASVFAHTQRDTVRVEVKTNWRTRLEAIRRFRTQIPVPGASEAIEGVMGQEAYRDFTIIF